MQSITLSPGLDAAVKNLKETSVHQNLRTEHEGSVAKGLSGAEWKYVRVAFKDEKKEPVNAWY